MKKNLVSFICLFTILFYSCKKDPVTSPDMGYNYWPGTVGSWIIYDVDSTIYPDNNGDTIFYKYQLKEVIESSYNDNEGRPALRIERYRRYYQQGVSYDSIPWTLTDVWSANKTAAKLEMVEENIRYIKLAFPVKISNTWNGNAQNTLDEWIYKYSDMDKPRNTGTLSFDSTALVVQKDLENLIQKQYYIEVYARNVGLVSKQIIDVNSQGNVNYSLPIMNRIVSGVVYRSTINSYGRN
jgi:hypothetical protein